MTTEERLRALRAPINTIAVSRQAENTLRQLRGHAHAEQQVRQIETTRRYEAQKNAAWDRGR